MTAGKVAQHHIGSGRVFDAHLHIIDPRFPLVASEGYLPEPFTVDDYRARTAGLRIDGGAVVSGSFQAFDQTYLLDALGQLGPSFVGVTQLPASAPDELILELDRAGVRAVRFNLRRGGSEQLEQLEALAHRVFALADWHVELYLDGRDLLELEARLLRLPRVCIDHLGLHRDGLSALLRLVEGGAKVKASGFGRVNLDVPATARAITNVDPSALLFGTDLPATRVERPFFTTDITLLVDAVGSERAALALHDNATAWYRPQEAQHDPER
jgi:predicted TIM-barrel fold metal-dependent hydrolase